jgi:Undecaprenyl-phosphate galactose phosphotransferase WbaP
MSSSSRAIDSGRLPRRIGDRVPTAEGDEVSDALVTTDGVTGFAQQRLGRECLTQHLRLILPLALMDLAVLSAAFLCGCELVRHVSGVPIAGQAGHLAALVTTAIILYGSLGLFQTMTFQPVDEFRQIVLWSALSVVLLAIADASFAGLSLDVQWALGLSIVIMALAGPAVRGITRRALSRFLWWPRPLLIIGHGESAQRLQATLTRQPSLGFRVVGFVDDRQNGISRNGRQISVDRLGHVDDLATIAVAHRSCWAVISASSRDRAGLEQTVDLCTETIPNVVIVFDVAGIPALWTRVEDYGGLPGMHFQSSLMLLTQQAAKRFVDLLILALVSPIVVPLMLLTAVALKVASPHGPIFFGHLRAGRNGKTIVTWKFRTMVTNASQVLEEHLAAHPERREEWYTFCKLTDDPRVIPYVGRILRKFSLDELPQLWNVVRGDMSLVGPRPVPLEDVSRYTPTFRLYKKMRPGITGLWQVSGRNLTTFQERVDLDAYYVTNWSPWLDLYILFRTIRTVLLCEGAY